MIIATDLRPGTVIHFEGDLHKIVDAVYHAGGGKLTGTVHAKLQSVRTGSIIERRFRPDDRLDRVELERAGWQYIYADGDDLYLMNPQTYEQIPIRRETLGQAARFLRPEMTVSVESYEGRPVHVIVPEAVELRVATTSQPSHQRETSAMKLATLENGFELLVPLFIKVGDIVRVDTATGRYLDRARAKSA
jgi:elongation factor P